MTQATSSFYAHLDNFCVIRASGSDTESFLHGQLTNDLKQLRPSQVQYHGYCSPKGRLLALMHVLLDGDDFLLLLPKTGCDALIKRLRMFVMRAKVTLDVDPNTQVLGISDSRSYPAEAPHPVFALAKSNAALVLVSEEQMANTESTLLTAYDKGSSLNWAASLLLAGVPQIHPSTVDKFVPQMLNLDLLDGLSFSKGCYPGQEIIARTRYLGKVKRRMHLFQAAAGVTAEPGSSLYADGKEQAVGVLVEILTVDDRISVASAVIRLEHADQELHLGSDDGPLLQPVPLPYSLEDSQQCI